MGIPHADPSRRFAVVVLFVIFARNLVIGSPADLGVGIYISRIDGKYKLESHCLRSNIFF